MSNGGNYLFVTDTTGGALLVYHLRPKLELIRRYPLPGSPYGIAIDIRRQRMYVTQTARNRLTELIVGGRPSLVRRYATPQQPNTVAVDEASGRVFVTGKVDGVLQLLDPDASASGRGRARPAAANSSRADEQPAAPRSRPTTRPLTRMYVRSPLPQMTGKNASSSSAEMPTGTRT